MSVTFSGGFTFTGGGFTATLAAPSTPTAGWFTTGTYTSTVDRMIFSTDTAAVSVRGPISIVKIYAAGFGSNSYGYNTGGYNGSVSIMSSVDRITYATDTATATARGPLTTNRWKHGATSDRTTYGWAIAGEGTPALSSVDRITFATDTATATSRGPISIARYNSSSTGTDTYGWYIAGVTSVPYGLLFSTIDRITYATDTAIASVRGPLAFTTNWGVGAVTDYTTYGWAGGGYTGAPAGITTIISRITYANDTVTTTNRGTLTASSYQNGATSPSDTTYGWFGGGSAPGGYSNITRLVFATDTAATTNRTYLSSARYGIASLSGTQ
jgi:uncharacterized protein YdeI (BOF family)